MYTRKSVLTEPIMFYFNFLVMTSVKRTSRDTTLDYKFFKNVIPYLLFKRFTFKFIWFLYMCTRKSSLTKINFFISIYLQSQASRGHPAVQYQILKLSKMLYLTYFKIKEYALSISEECVHGRTHSIVELYLVAHPAVPGP